MIVDAVIPALPPRLAHGHKGTFGTVVVIGGCLGGRREAPRMMLGGTCLTARAALRAGCGLVALAVPAALASHAIEIVPEATVIPLATTADGALHASEVALALDAVRIPADAFVIGPGLGLGDAAAQVLLRLIASTDAPVIIDADAITLFAQIRDAPIDLRTSAIFTPHPGEACRLAEGVGVAVGSGFLEGDTQARRNLAARLAQRLGAIMCVKGSGTLTCDGLHLWTSTSGNAALATGGSGDVLSGVIASFVAQFCQRTAPRCTMGEATALAVEVHARAGDRWRAAHGDAGLLAHELTDLIPEVLREMRQHA